MKNRIYSFFFQDSNHDLKWIRRARIIFGTLVLFNLIQMGFVWSLFWGPDSLLPVARAGLFSQFPQLYEGSWIFFSIYFVITLFFICGAFFRITSILLFLCIVSSIQANPYWTIGADEVMKLFSFFFCFSNAGQQYSFLRNPKWMDWPQEMDRFFIRLIQLQVFSIYFITGFTKLNSLFWQNGEALQYLFRNPTFFRFELPQFFLYPSFGAAMTYSVVAIELIAPLFLWFKKTRMIAVAILLGFHLSLEILMELLFFQWFMIFGLAFFLIPTIFLNESKK